MDEKLHLVSGIVRGFAEATADYHRLLDAVVARMAEVMADICTLQLVSSDGATLEPAAVHATDPAARALVAGNYARDPVRLSEHAIYRELVETGQPQLIPVFSAPAQSDHMQSGHGNVAATLRIHSVLLVPLRVHGQSIGTLTLSRNDPARPSYAQADLDLAQLLADHAALAIANARLMSTSRSVQEASRLKSEFLANMSHELRTPLNSIIGFGELIHDEEVGPLTSKQKEFVGHILTSGRHLLQLINDVLDLSKVEAGKVEFRPERIDLAALLGEVIAILRTTASSRGVRIESRIDDELGEIVIDPGRLKQVLYNFLSNALKFTPAGGTVEVRVTGDGAAGFRIEVEDTGIGIAAADLPRLFVEFQQLDAGTAKKHAGTGLGLALTRRLVEAQGGHVGVRSVPGQGSVFHASLPRRTPRRRSAAPPMGPADERPPEAAQRSILVVDDVDDDRAAIAATLRAAGFHVDTAASATEAIARCADHRYDALTLDLLLPDGSGLDVLRAVRGGANHQDLKVVVVTVVTEPGAVAGFAVDDVLCKPLDPGALIATLRRHGITPQPTGRVWIVDDDRGSLELMLATLESLGFAGACFASAGEALAHLDAELPIAVVLDLMMPEIDGFAFLDRFRTREACRMIPVLVWTVKDLSEEEYERLRASAQGVLAKGNGAGSIGDVLREVLHG